MKIKPEQRKRITIQITVNNDKALNELKKEEGIKKSDFINYAIEKQLKKQKK